MRNLVLFFVMPVLAVWGGDDVREEIRLKLGAEVAAFLKSSPVKFDSDCSTELKLCFHRFKTPFSRTDLPVVTVYASGRELILDHVVGVTIYDDEVTQGHLDSVELTLRGVPSRSDVPVAKQFAYGVIHNILDAGWVGYIYPDEPRISGKESLKLSDCRKVLGHWVLVHPCFDPLYEMTDEQWLSVDGFYNWYFYKDGYYLKFKAWRSRGETDPPGQASYLFTVELNSEQEFWLEAFEGEDRLRWKELMPALLEKYQAGRKMIESEAEHAGIEINRSYQDPPISALEN